MNVTHPIVRILVILTILAGVLGVNSAVQAQVMVRDVPIVLETNASSASTSFPMTGEIKDIVAWVPYWTGTDTTATLALAIKPFGSDVPTTATYSPISWTDVDFTAANRAHVVKCCSAILTIFSYGNVTLTVTTGNAQTADRKMWVRLIYER